jgi:hypothetical protein
LKAVEVREYEPPPHSGDRSGRIVYAVLGQLDGWKRVLFLWVENPDEAAVPAGVAREYYRTEPLFLCSRRL